MRCVPRFCGLFWDLRVQILWFRADFGCQPAHWTHINLCSVYISVCVCACVCFRKRTGGRRQTRSFSGKNTNSKQENSLECRLVETRSRTPHSTETLRLEPAASHSTQSGRERHWWRKKGRNMRSGIKDLMHIKTRVMISLMWLREIWMTKITEVSSVWHSYSLNCLLRTLSEHLQDVQAVVVASCFMTHYSAHVQKQERLSKIFC